MFSISVPVYGQAHVIKTTLESIKVQSVPYELAVLDATPDDSVQQVLEGYRDIINYTYHKKDNGQTAAIQEGWNNTNGEIVAWLNADDYYFPDTLQKVAQIFEQNPDIDVVYGNSIHVTEDGQFISYFPAIDQDVSLLTKGCIITQPSCFVRRTAMEKVGGLNTSLHYTMDWDFWIRLYHAGDSFHMLEETLSAVRIYPETKTLSGSSLRYKEINNILKTNTSNISRLRTLLSFKYYDLLNKNNVGLEQLQFLILRFLRALKYTANKNGSIYGLQKWTNLVEQKCTIMLPWYSPTVPKSIAVTTNQNDNLSIETGETKYRMDKAGNTAVSFAGKEYSGFEYTTKVDISIKNQVLSFDLQSEENNWQLLKVEIN